MGVYVKPAITTARTTKGVASDRLRMCIDTPGFAALAECTRSAGFATRCVYGKRAETIRLIRCRRIECAGDGVDPETWNLRSRSTARVASCARLGHEDQGHVCPRDEWRAWQESNLRPAASKAAPRNVPERPGASLPVSIRGVTRTVE